MKPHPRRHCASGWLIACLVLAAGACLSPPSARAGCSHYVTTGMAAARPGTAELDPVVVLGVSSGGMWRISPLERVPAKPCSGFGCSRDSSPPMTASPALPRTDAFGRFELSTFALHDHSSPFLPDSDSPRPLDRADRLSRPPRP